MDIAAFRLNLTVDGWYIDVDESEDVAGSGPRRTPERTRPCQVLVIAVVPDHDGHARQDAVQAAAVAMRSAVGSLLERDDIQVNLMVVAPETGRNG